jgi:hypothetical protein
MLLRDRMKNQTLNKTRVLALCSIFSALGVIILYLGSLIEIIDLSMAVIASLLVIIAVIEIGGIYPWLIYAVTSVLSVLLLPNKFVAVVYFAFAGFYPILKSKIERVRGIVCALVKLGVFNLCLLAMYGISRLFVIPLETEYGLAVTAVILNLIFVLYDFALTRLISAYVYVWRKKLKIDKWNFKC